MLYDELCPLLLVKGTSLVNIKYISNLVVYPIVINSNIWRKLRSFVSF